MSSYTVPAMSALRDSPAAAVKAEQPVKGRRAIAQAIRNVGIDTVFTVAGGHFLPVYHEIGRLGEISVVTARHEQGAGYMASGYALAAGRPGVVFAGAPGPGATNLVTAVANAQADSIPLLVLSAQVDSRYVHRNILQYCDNVGLLAPFAKSSVQAASLEELPRLLATGLQLAAAGRPGPVHVALPQNFQAQTTPPALAVKAAAPTPGSPAPRHIEELAARIAAGARPALLAGHGVLRAGASRRLRAVAECLGAPVATSRSGIGSISTSHPLSAGMLGFYGTDTARQAVGKADLVLVVGCALGEQTTFGWRPDLFDSAASVVQIDVDPSQIGRNYPVEQGIACDAGAALEALADRISGAATGELAAGAPTPSEGAGGNSGEAKSGSSGEAKSGSSGGAEALRTWFGRRPVRYPPQNDPSRGLSAAQVIRAFNKRRRADTVFSADIGNHRLWVCDQLDVTHPEGLLQSCEFDAMGFSLPAAVGAAVARPGARAVSISGDGGFVHTMGELSVAAELGLGVAAVVFEDGALGILRHQAEGFFAEDHFVRLAPIDFAAVGEAFGVESRRVGTADELDDAVAWAMESPGPVLLAVVIDPEEVFPPLRSKIEQRKRDLIGL